MVTRAERNRREAGQLFRDLFDSHVTHIRVGQGRGDHTSIRLLMTAAQAHGLDGVCTCCPRRPAGEPRPVDEARAAVRPLAVDEVAGVRAADPVPLDLDVDPAARAAAIAQARAAAIDSTERFGRQA